MYLLDSDVVIWLLRRHAGVMRLVERLASEGRLAVSALTRLEVRAGMRPREKAATDSLLAALETYPVTEKVADLAGDFIRDYRATGVTLDQIDSAIASTAIVHALVLVTMNTRHYPMAGLVLLPAAEHP